MEYFRLSLAEKSGHPLTFWLALPYFGHELSLCLRSHCGVRVVCRSLSECKPRQRNSCRCPPTICWACLSSSFSAAHLLVRAPGQEAFRPKSQPGIRRPAFVVIWLLGSEADRLGWAAARHCAHWTVTVFWTININLDELNLHRTLLFARHSSQAYGTMSLTDAKRRQTMQNVYGIFLTKAFKSLSFAVGPPIPCLPGCL